MDNPYASPAAAADAPPADRAAAEEARRPWLVDEARLVTAGLAIAAGVIASTVATVGLFVINAGASVVSGHAIGFLSATIVFCLLVLLAFALPLVRLRPSARILLWVYSAILAFSALRLGNSLVLFATHGDATSPALGRRMLLVLLPTMLLAIAAVARFIWLLLRPATARVLSRAHHDLVAMTPDLTRARPWQPDAILIAWVLWNALGARLMEAALR
jgi:hypothetical protein